MSGVRCSQCGRRRRAELLGLALCMVCAGLVSHPDEALDELRDYLDDTRHRPHYRELLELVADESQRNHDLAFWP